MPLDAARANSKTGVINEAFAAIGVTGDTPCRGRARRTIGWVTFLRFSASPLKRQRHKSARIPIKRPSDPA